MVLVATIGISALSLVLIDARKNSKMISSRSIADADIDRAVNYIGSLMMTPNNCSATFAGLPLAEPGKPKYLNETGIYKCPSDPSDPNAPCTRASRQVAINFDDWLIYPTETVTKAKLVEAKYELEEVYNSLDLDEKDNLYDQADHYDLESRLIIYNSGNPNPNLLIRPAYYKLTLKFVKNLGWSNGKMVTSTKEVSFHVPVVTKLYDGEGKAKPAEKIIACPINPKSAVPYYNPFPD